MLTDISYKERAEKHNYNMYFCVEGDRDGNIRKEEIVPANACCNCYSVTKVFVVTAIGMLYDRGLVRPEDKMVKFLGKYLPDTYDLRWNDITIHHLLKHEGGMPFVLDIDVDDASLFPHDYLNSLFTSELAFDPGTSREYTDAAFYILSRVVSEVTGEKLVDFMRPVLMDVMNFRELAWSTCPHGYSMGATGLYIHTEDMVKLGILYLRRGDWMGRRIISEDWVDTVLERGYELRKKGNGWYAKAGILGQMLALNPEKDIAVAWHSYGEIDFNEMIGIANE